MTAPRIGITRCSRLDDYVISVERAGATARVLEVAEDPNALAGDLDGLVLTGGDDVDPVLYGEPRHGTVKGAEEGRDAFEIALVRQALAADLPLLAICRGAQVLNVATGGTLVQDIPSAITSALTHSLEHPGDCVAHGIAIVSGSRLRQALGAVVDEGATCRVNSRHHQSVGRLGSGLIASAVADDGVIEAIEAPAAEFCLGVQWHPENFWRTGEFSNLFAAFVAAARARRARESKIR